MSHNWEEPVTGLLRGGLIYGELGLFRSFGMAVEELSLVLMPSANHDVFVATMQPSQSSKILSLCRSSQGMTSRSGKVRSTREYSEAVFTEITEALRTVLDMTKKIT
jgi:hypothetical protein